MWGTAFMAGYSSLARSFRTRVKSVWAQLVAFPWRNTAITLRDRFSEDRLGLTAGSLTFTTTISLVPLFTVALAIFTAFPMFSRMEEALNRWLFQGLIPEHIARQVSTYLLQFAGKAGQMGWAGALVLLVSALALILTIDRKLNDIWRVRRLRPFTQRVLVYWALLTLGPLLAGLSLTLSSYALSASRGWVGGAHPLLMALFDVLEFGAILLAMAAFYRFVPNALVRWSHALWGALFVAVAFDLAKRLLAWYLATIPTYSAVYGAFATLPILLIWLYLVWVIVLLGAVVVAYLPSLMAGVARRGDTPGWAFQLAIEILRELQASQHGTNHGLSLDELARRLRVDDLQLEQPLETLVALDWVGQLAEAQARYVLLADPARTPAEPLVERLLLPQDASTAPVWVCSRWGGAVVADLLGSSKGPDSHTAA
jgi:membrane protein